ncbi:MAG TPA: hypothetical protein VH413_16380 [Verrucomicrobiae bacterium]|jgi:hypothetical protein|nr:hypothetical protein [Verrucomicrobiae bacterium]
MEIKITADLESLPEFRLLNHAIDSARNKNDGSVVALAMVVRLYRELAYHAQTTNRAGWLNRPGVILFGNSCLTWFGDLEAVKLLEESGWLKKEAEGNGYLCESFARLNANLASDFRSREEKGAMASALSRNRHRISHEAHQQASLLPAEIYRRENGTVIEQPKIIRLHTVIKTIDYALKLPSRSGTSYTPGLIADAAAAVESRTEEEMREFYLWLAMNRENPAVPKTAEQILANFSGVFAMQRASV